MTIVLKTVKIAQKLETLIKIVYTVELLFRKLLFNKTLYTTKYFTEPLNFYSKKFLFNKQISI